MLTRAAHPTAFSRISRKTLTNDFFVNLLDMGTDLAAKSPTMRSTVFEGTRPPDGQTQMDRYSAVDLVFGSNSQLRAIAEVYAGADGQKKFVNDFVAAWNKVMNLDRFDLS
jgi:catalase-peroxidase